jgi:hypothetical protein
MEALCLRTQVKFCQTTPRHISEGSSPVPLLLTFTLSFLLQFVIAIYVDVEEDEMGGSCSTKEGEEERV